ncbi:MAG TPA: hypothetical protein VMS37_28990, partial [Verrucomicrobiae bacterium]|nr:hypothetical protein [Verrucomicrobiae bacterium]
RARPQGSPERVLSLGFQQYPFERFGLKKVHDLQILSRALGSDPELCAEPPESRDESLPPLSPGGVHCP